MTCAVLESEAVPDGFDARRDARSRTYRYRVLTRPARSPFERGRSLWWPRPLDRAALDECAAALVGTHDFTAFTRPTPTTCASSATCFRAEWRDEGDGLLAFWIEADTFMRHMVRVLVGTMLDGVRPGGVPATLGGSAPQRGGGDRTGPRPLPGVRPVR